MRMGVPFHPANDISKDNDSPKRAKQFPFLGNKLPINEK
jgi:hypothetical protein